MATSDIANLRRSALTNYDPERGLKEIAVADAGVRHFTRAAKSNDPLVAARNREELYDAIGKKILAQAEYVVWRDSVVERGGDQKSKFRNSNFDPLPDADPGKIIAHRWRRSYCIQTGEGTAIEPTLLAEAIRDAQEKCIRAVERGMKRDDGETVLDDLPELDERCRLILGDMRDVDLPSDSIDCIITDPPYPQEFIPLYGDLVERAAAWLKPGGSLLAMAGSMYLPRVLNALDAGSLTYQWTNCYLTLGQSAQIFPRKVTQMWKPVFWYVKGSYDGPGICDVFKSDKADKEFHDWGQSESGFAALVRAFSKPGDVICDPFLGGGTTGVVSLALNRFFVGIENNPTTFDTAKTRIAKAAI
jgi:site-specific DNA-methyltransferase (adenine-specific)